MIVAILVVATYLLFNAFITMLILQDRETKHKGFVAGFLMLFGLPIMVVIVGVAIIAIIVEGIRSILHG